MKNKEKAREIAIKIEKSSSFLSGFGKKEIVVEELKNAAIEMAAWKDKQFSDRVEMILCIDCHEFESCNNCPKYKLKKELLGL